MSNTGGRPETVTDEEILQYLRETDERVVTSREVADGVGLSRRSAHRRLSSLAEEGRVERKNVGGRTTVWWASAEERALDAPAAPLRQLVGGLDKDAADQARERSAAWREEFNEAAGAPDSDEA